MATPEAYDSAAKGTGSDLDSVSKRTNADHELYFTTLENGDRECRNVKKRNCVAKYISRKERGHYSSQSTQDDRLLKWIVDDQQALSVVEVPSFKSFVNGINPKYAIPTRKTITRRILSTYASRLNDMKSRLQALDCKISLTYDVWTSKAKANLPYAGQ
ncbi:hypothetical protein V1509DRAFT_641203 [Lipomyces kononenkoae]